MKKIADYIHLYIGSSFINPETGKISKLTFDKCQDILSGKIKAKLLLRKISSISDIETELLEEKFNMTIWNEHGFYSSDGIRMENFIPKNAEIIKWFLDHSFDIFGLIDSDLAKKLNH